MERSGLLKKTGVFLSAEKIRKIGAPSKELKKYIKPRLPTEIKYDFHGKLYEKYLADTNLNGPFIESFNVWIEEGIKRTFENRRIPFRENETSIPYGHFYLTNIREHRIISHMGKLITPGYARKYNETYSVLLIGTLDFAHNEYFYEEHGIVNKFDPGDPAQCGSLSAQQIGHFRDLKVSLEKPKEILIGEVPIMLGSIWDVSWKTVVSGSSETTPILTTPIDEKTECIKDPGCIFIIEGKEKFIVADGGLRQNRINTFEIKEKKGGINRHRNPIVSQIICTTDQYVNNRTYNPFRTFKITKAVTILETYPINEVKQPILKIKLDFFSAVMKELKTNTEKSNVTLNVYAIFRVLEDYMWRIQEAAINKEFEALLKIDQIPSTEEAFSQFRKEKRILSERSLQTGQSITDFIVSFLQLDGRPKQEAENIKKRIFFKLKTTQLTFDGFNEVPKDRFVYHRDLAILFQSLEAIPSKIRGTIFSNDSDNSQEREKYYDYMVEQIEEDLFGNMNIPQFSQGLNLKRVTIIYKKLSLLAIMINRTLMTMLGINHPEDRDDLAIQRAYPATRYISTLFTTIWQQIVNQIVRIPPFEKAAGKSYISPIDIMTKLKDLLKIDINKGLRSGIFLQEFTKSFKGLWGTERSKYKEQVVEHVKREHSILQIWSNIRKISSQIDTNTKTQSVRESDEFFANFICLAETPEGPACGIVRNFAILCYPSLAGDEKVVLLALEKHEMLSVTSDAVRKNPLILDGKFEGYCDALSTENFLRTNKRKGIFSRFTSIVFSKQENILYVSLDAYRMTAPLLVVDQNTGKLVLDEIDPKVLEECTWDTLIHMGAVEYVDPYEQRYIFIAPTVDYLNNRNRKLEELQEKVTLKISILNKIKKLNESNPNITEFHIPTESLTKMVYNQRTLADAERDLAEAKADLEKSKVQFMFRRYTHCEIDPTQIMSISAATIPYSHHNHAPRNTYQCLSLNERILLGDKKTFITMKDIKDGDEIITIDPTTGTTSITQIYNKFIKKVIRLFLVETVDGREIRATMDHQFLTQTGDFVRLDALNISFHKVAICTWSITDQKKNPLEVESWEDQAPENHIFLAIKRIEEIGSDIGYLVGDFTTLSGNHTFITDHGFITHNCTLGKQGVGINNSRYPNRMDPQAKILAYPNRPLAETMMNKNIGLDKLPSGVMLNVAIIVSEYSQEDSVIIKKRASEMGAFLMVKFFVKSHKIKEAPENIQSLLRDLDFLSGQVNQNFLRDIEKVEFIGLLPELYGTPSYEALGKDGLPIRGHILGPNDRFCGTYRIVNENNKLVFKDTSPGIGPYDKGRVDRSEVVRLADKTTIIRVKLSYAQYPLEGDKIASRSAQKTTISRIEDESDMPFVAYGPNKGMIPDIIFNSNALPSRMTIGKIIEMVYSKEASFSGNRVNASSFRDKDDDLLMRNLSRFALNRYGNEIMFSGTTGEPLTSQMKDTSGGISAEIFLCPCYISALKHQVEAKGQGRGSTGEYDPLSRSPAKSRSKGGGVRMGEMERDVFNVAAAPAILDDSLCERSDKTVRPYCKVCSHVKILTEEEIRLNTPYSKLVCSYCKTEGQYVNVRFPFALSLFQNTLAGMNIALKASLV